MSKEAAEPSGPTPEQRHVVAIVLIAGTVGGFASWAYGWISNNPVVGGFWSLPLSLFFGAFAAGVGVFVLANTDVTAFGRLIFFAALCGFSWKPVIDAGSAFVKQTITEQAQKKADETATDQTAHIAALATALTNASPEVVAQEFQSVAADLTDALGSYTEINDPTMSKQAQSNLTAAVRTLAMIAPKAPSVAIPELQQFSVTAQAIGATKVSFAATTSLNTLAATNREIAGIRNATIATNPVIRTRPITTKRHFIPR